MTIWSPAGRVGSTSVSYTHLRAHETKANLVCRLLLETKTVAQAELLEDVRDVRLHRVLAHDERRCDLGVGEPTRDEAQDLDLAHRQRLELGWSRRRLRATRELLDQ